MTEYYRIFDTTLSCDFPLPELPQIHAQDIALSVKTGEGDPDQFDSQGFEFSPSWCKADQ